MFSFLHISLNFIAYTILGTLIILLCAFGYYQYHEHELVVSQLKYNNAQLEQVIRDQQTHIRETKQLDAVSENVISTLSERNRNLSEKLKKLDQYLRSKRARSANRRSSEILKRTIQSILEAQ